MNGLALCAGTGMLDEGLRAGCEFLDIPYRTVCYVEREAFAAATLVARMADGALDEAPIWSDLASFVGKEWCGKVDCITAGFPCQPHSVAGKRKGLADERWIWPDIVRIIRETDAWLCWLENVPGLVSTGGLAACLYDLSSIGFDAEWGVLGAGDVGAAHKRERLFILAYRHGVGNDRTGIARRQNNRLENNSDAMDDTDHPVGRTDNVERNDAGKRKDGKRKASSCAGTSSYLLGNTNGAGSQRRGNDIGEHANEQIAWSGSLGIFAPGQNDPRWPDIIDRHPHLAPATEPGICGVVDGLAVVVDESRADQLRAIGNGVVPLQAATAFVLLARRARLMS